MTQDAISTHLLAATAATLSSPLGLSLFLPARRCAFKHRLVTQVDQIEQCADCLETPTPPLLFTPPGF